MFWVTSGNIVSPSPKEPSLSEQVTNAVFTSLNPYLDLNLNMNFDPKEYQWIMTYLNLKNYSQILCKNLCSLSQ